MIRHHELGDSLHKYLYFWDPVVGESLWSNWPTQTKGEAIHEECSEQPDYSFFLVKGDGSCQRWDYLKIITLGVSG